MNRSAQRTPDPVYRTILVPLDGSHFASGAIPTARALAARFGATIHTVTVATSALELPRFRARAARALGTDPDDPRIHLEVDTDVAGTVHGCATDLDSCLVCLSTHGGGRAAGTLIGSTARDLLARGRQPIVVAGPCVVHPDPEGETAIPPLGVDDLVACVDGTSASERGLPVTAAWAHALGMKLTIVTVAEPCPSPMRIGAPWRRHHGPNEDAAEYVRHLGEQWELVAPGLDTCVVYDPISAAAGMKDYLAGHPTGLVAVTSHLRDRFAHKVFGSGATDIVRASTAPTLVIPAQAVEA